VSASMLAFCREVEELTGTGGRPADMERRTDLWEP
jgi:hypothetical protein